MKSVKTTMFQNGHVPANKMKVGEYTHTTDGYLIQKVQEEGTQRQRFQFVHRAVWKKHYGSIPKGKIIIFLDGNKDNCSIENLALVDRRENLEVTRRSLRFNQAELTAVGITIAKLRIAIKMRNPKVRSHKTENNKNKAENGE